MFGIAAVTNDDEIASSTVCGKSVATLHVNYSWARLSGSKSRFFSEYIGRKLPVAASNVPSQRSHRRLSAPPLLCSLSTTAAFNNFKSAQTLSLYRSLGPTKWRHGYTRINWTSLIPRFHNIS